VKNHQLCFVLVLADVGVALLYSAFGADEFASANRMQAQKVATETMVGHHGASVPAILTVALCRSQELGPSKLKLRDYQVAGVNWIALNWAAGASAHLARTNTTVLSSTVSSALWCVFHLSVPYRPQLDPM